MRDAPGRRKWMYAAFGAGLVWLTTAAAQQAGARTPTLAEAVADQLGVYVEAWDTVPASTTATSPVPPAQPAPPAIVARSQDVAAIAAAVPMPAPVATISAIAFVPPAVPMERTAPIAPPSEPPHTPARAAAAPTAIAPPRMVNVALPSAPPPAPTPQRSDPPAVALRPRSGSAERELAWTPVDDDHLDTMRGGFETASGLRVGFGIERVVYINGSLAASTQLYIPDVGHMTAADARALATMLGSVTWIRNGPGNTFDPTTMATTYGATVIQNSLDNQVIRNQITINAAVNTLQDFKAINAMSTLQSAVFGAAAGR